MSDVRLTSASPGLRFRLWPGASTTLDPWALSSKAPGALIQPTGVQFSRPLGESGLYATTSGREAIWLALDGVASDGEAWITSSVGTPPRRLSPCVAQAVGRRAGISDSPSDRTVAVVIVHEWGIPHSDRANLVGLANQRRWRVVDDCAHAFQYGLGLAVQGATVAFSLPKLFPKTGGGLLANPGSVLRDIRRPLPAPAITRLLVEAVRRGERHRANWTRLYRIAIERGLSSLDSPMGETVPQVFRLAIRSQFSAQAVFSDEGIETTPPYYTGWLALPCHSELGDAYWLAIGRALDRLSKPSPALRR